MRTLTLYTPLNPQACVLGQSFAATCGYLDTLGGQGSAAMPTMVVELLSEVARAPFVGLDPNVWRRELLNAVNHAVEIGGEEVVRQILGTALRADLDLARVLIEGLAERWFPYARDSLVAHAREATSQDSSANTTAAQAPGHSPTSSPHWRNASVLWCEQADHSGARSPFSVDGFRLS